jgi:hypothetical protein
MIDIIPVKDLSIVGHSQVIGNLILNHSIKIMAEVGVYKGENMRTILRSEASKQLTEYVGIDPWAVNEDHMTNSTPERWDDMYFNVVKYLPWFKQLRLIRFPSEKVAPLYWDGYFDMVYIDGDHHYESVIKDIKTWLPKVKKGGIIAGHDYVESPDLVPSIYGPVYNDDYHKNYIMGINKAVHEAFGENFIKERCTVWYKIIE